MLHHDVPVEVAVLKTLLAALALRNLKPAEILSLSSDGALAGQFFRETGGAYDCHAAV